MVAHLAERVEPVSSGNRTTRWSTVLLVSVLNPVVLLPPLYVPTTRYSKKHGLARAGRGKNGDSSGGGGGSGRTENVAPISLCPSRFLATLDRSCPSILHARVNPRKNPLYGT
ncbi:hypothetical protein WN55_10640 [Dufourea novaeangliae]|uniref:Uncharacterized protein n=1 Tax=Dufourea novaeangliae TaxID=178035 RepID=A0A154P483_DUFNO|nr:hypothetical protein WN55_10640 [Dufourea novaeangliae]